MAHSLSKIYIHAIWSTKDREPLLRTAFRDQVFLHLENRFDESGCTPRVVNGMSEHVHAFFVLSPEKSIAEIMQLVKGESSHWINQQDFLQTKFAWQVGYCALSVSASQVMKVEEYIRKQETHHRKRSFNEECERLFARYGLDAGNR